MGFIVPDDYEVEALNAVITPALSLKLYGNDHTPAAGDAAGAYTEIAGGGYAAKPLTFAHWVVTTGPSSAVYDSNQEFTFTGAISAPGTIYGYYVTRDSDGKLMFAERFAPAVVPFSPVNGSLIRILPKYTVQSQF